MHKNSQTCYKVAIGGVVCALCVALMFLTGVFPLLSFAIPIYAGALMIVVAYEVSTSWAFSAYCAVSLLSLFFTPYKDSALLFIMFFGYYPIIAPKLSCIKSKLIRLIVKLAMFNGTMILWYKLIVWLLGMYDFFNDFSFLGEFAVVGVLIFANSIFFLYDYTIDAVIKVYIEWFRPTYFGKKKKKKQAAANKK